MESQELLKEAEKLVNLNLNYVQRPDFQRDKQNQVGFLLGASGVQAVASIIYATSQKQGRKKFEFSRLHLTSFCSFSKNR